MIITRIAALTMLLTRRSSLTIARLALALIYIWFGALKVAGLSPASPLVLALLARTLPFITPATFLILFGAYEVLIGLAFLYPRAQRLALGLIIPHLFCTLLPLLTLPALTWQSWFAPTLEGQYIIKNALIIALVWEIAANLSTPSPRASSRSR